MSPIDIGDAHGPPGRRRWARCCSLRRSRWTGSPRRAAATLALGPHDPAAARPEPGRRLGRRQRVAAAEPGAQVDYAALTREQGAEAALEPLDAGLEALFTGAAALSGGPAGSRPARRLAVGGRPGGTRRRRRIRRPGHAAAAAERVDDDDGRRRRTRRTRPVRGRDAGRGREDGDDSADGVDTEGTSGVGTDGTSGSVHGHGRQVRRRIDGVSGTETEGAFTDGSAIGRHELGGRTGLSSPWATKPPAIAAVIATGSPSARVIEASVDRTCARRSGA